jgi:Universal stress protein UspA and related nucleotide-binding proteins
MFQRILIPLDGSSQAEQAIPVASKIAQETHSHILLVCVINHAHADSTCTNASGEAWTRFEEAQSYLKRISDIIAATAASVETFVVAGPAVPTILKIATITQTDLIVLSSHDHGHSGAQQMRGQTLGNVTRALLISTHTPILVRQADGTLIYLKQALQSLTVTCL